MKKEKKIGKRKVEVHKMEGLYPYVRLEDFMKVCKGLEEENKKLKEENEEQHKTIESLYDNVKYFDHCLCDIDSKLISKQEENEKLKEERDLYKARNEELNENCFGLSKENKKLNIKVASLEGEIKGLNYTIEELHKELSECECSMHFENDEVGYRKRECKKLKEELDKYKKQYEHSMGEDDELIYEEGLYE